MWSYQGSKPFLAGGRLYSAMGDTLKCVDPGNESVLWQRPLHPRGPDEPELLDSMVTPPALVNGKAVEKALLRPNDRITLGTTCQLQFRQPAPVSATARLDLTSGQKLPLGVDGVILMADTLLLGPGPQVHIAVPDLKHAVVLYRHKDGLGVRCPGPLLIDGQRCQERGLLRPASSVSGEDFAFAIEPLVTR